MSRPTSLSALSRRTAVGSPTRSALFPDTPATWKRIAALGGEAAPMTQQQFAQKASEDSRRGAS